MRSHHRNVIVLALATAALLTFASCKSDSDKSDVQKTTAAAIQPGVPGGIFVETRTLTAKVTDIDQAKRAVTLATNSGQKETVTCGPDVRNFAQIRVGDQVTVKVTQELAVYMSPVAPPKDSAAAAVVLAPKGAKPGGIVAATVQVTATVTAIDLQRHKAALRFGDGTTQTVAVRPDVDLTQRKVGELVYIRVTQAIAISVAKP
jgi:hypothetical protein